MNPKRAGEASAAEALPRTRGAVRRRRSWRCTRRAGRGGGLGVDVGYSSAMVRLEAVLVLALVALSAPPATAQICERTGGYSCHHPDDPHLPWSGCIETASDGEYLLIPRLGAVDLVPSWEDADQAEHRMLFTYLRCRSAGDCHEVEVRAERSVRDVRLVGQGRWRDYSLEMRAAVRATDPPIVATEVQRFLGSVYVTFWTCPATLVHVR